jgi:ketosteroid isomerase-like protein
MTRLALSAIAGLLIGAHPAWAHVTVTWKVHQRLADGTASHWVGEPGTPSPAPMTTLSAAGQDDAAAVTAWLGSYDAAFNAKDLEKLATFYHPDVTIYEGAGINNGWADYRDRHLGPELKAFQNLQFAHSETKVTMLPGGQSAYATSRYTLKAKMGERDIDSEGLATYVLVKGAEGTWQIRHSHPSSRPARRPAAE